MRKACDGKIGIFIALATLFFLTVQFSTERYTVKISSLQHQVKSVLKRFRYEYLVGSMDDNSASSTTTLLSEKSCDPKQKIAFAKTHKTGSSTIQNILFRFGDVNELNFAMPERSWMFSYQGPFDASWVLDQPWSRKGLDIFAFHSVWNKGEVAKLLPSAIYVTILRDPVDCFESNYVYMGLEKANRMNISQYAVKKARLNPKRKSKNIIGKNQLLWDLGLSSQDMENHTKVVEKIESLDREFHLVMLSDRFDESLVLLARLLCWDLEDVRYLKQNVRKNETRKEITEQARQILKNWLKADYMLYDHFKEKFDKLVERYGKEKMAEDVKSLRLRNKQLYDDCVVEKADNDKLKGEFKMAVSKVEGYIVDDSKPWCSSFARSEPSYTTKLRKKQQLRANFIGRKPLDPIEQKRKAQQLWKEKLKG